MRCVCPSVVLHAGCMRLPLRLINFFSLHSCQPSNQTDLQRPSFSLPASLIYQVLSSSFFFPRITTLSVMPPRHNHRHPLQDRNNRPNAPARVNDGLAAKQRGEDPIDSWRLAKNMTIKDPSQIITAIGSATNTHIIYDGKFEFRFWGSSDNV